MKALLAVLAALLVLTHPVPAAATVTAALTAAAVVISHPQLILAAELAALAVIATGIARSAGFTLRPIPWRTP